jgi:hypothetical protein
VLYHRGAFEHQIAKDSQSMIKTPKGHLRLRKFTLELRWTNRALPFFSGKINGKTSVFLSKSQYLSSRFCDLSVLAFFMIFAMSPVFAANKRLIRPVLNITN